MPSSSSSSSSNDIQLTAKEAKSFDAAFKSEEFRRLMADYVDSMSDPANREQQEAYISQLEANKELPPGKSLIRPNAGFVVKCHVSSVNGKPSKKKIFMNVVYADAITQPSSEKATTTIDDSSSPQSQAKWSVPYAIGPVRMEHDKSNNLVPTFDVCFHPRSLQYAHARKEFCDMVIGIAQSAVVDAYSKSSGEDITIDSDYSILKNVRYKNGTPKTLVVSAATTSDDDKVFKRVLSPSLASANLNDDINDGPLPDRVKVEEDRQVQEDAPDFAQETIDATVYDKNSSDEEIKKHIVKEVDPSNVAIIVPKYKIVEQGVLELNNHHQHDSSTRPKQLIVHVYLDNVINAAEIDLHVSETNLKVGSEEHGYSLDVQLPYPINSQKGKATFDKSKRTLILRLPLIPN